MTGSTPPWKRRFSRRGADQGPPDGPHRARDDERGPALPGSASLEPAADRTDLPEPVPAAAPAARRRAAVLRQKATAGVRKGGDRARAALAHLADRV
ncbi:hypothetical protein NGM37_59080, partial [Streptomyces sp. TRM76130]|nr:hypothetical protein [Streptomyces sp. TRM76130]